MKKHSFILDVITLLGAGALIQIIEIISAPLIMKLYTPAEFAVLTLFTTIISVLRPFSTLRVEMAMYSAKIDERAKIYFLSKNILSLTTIIILFFAIFSYLLKIEYFQSLGLYIFFIPAWHYFFGEYQILSTKSTVTKDFKILSTSKIYGSLSGIAVKILMGLKKILFSPLIISEVISMAISSFSLYYHLRKNDKLPSPHKIIYLNFKKLQDIKSYKDFPIYNGLSGVLDSAAQNAASLLIPLFFVQEILGIYGLIFKYFAIPLSFLGMSIVRVFSGRLVEIDDNKSLVKNLNHIIGFNFILSVLILASCFIISIWLNLGIINPKWSDLNNYLIYIIPIFLIRFTISPVSAIFLTKRKIKISFQWQLLNFCTTFSVLFISTKLFHLNIKEFFILYTLHDLFSYIYYYYLARKSLC